MRCGADVETWHTNKHQTELKEPDVVLGAASGAAAAAAAKLARKKEQTRELVQA